MKVLTCKHLIFNKICHCHIFPVVMYIINVNCGHIISGKTGKSYHFMYDETIAKKGQNDVISFLDYFFKKLLSTNVKKIYRFSDNCSAQNKNNALFQYLHSVAKSNL